MNWYSAETSDVFGNKFFSQSPLRSGYFAVATTLFAAVVLCSAWFFFDYRSRVPNAFMALLFIAVFIRALHSMSAGIMRHARLRQLCFEEDVTLDRPGEYTNAALGVAARAILDDLFYTNSTLLVFLCAVWILLHHLSPWVEGPHV